MMDSDRDLDQKLALLASQECLNGHAAEAADDGDDMVWGLGDD